MAEPTYIIRRISGECLQFVTTIKGMDLNWVQDQAKASLMTWASADTFLVIYAGMAKTWEWKVEAWPVVCTGISARWCPVCGDCSCRPVCWVCRERMPKAGPGFRCDRCVVEIDWEDVDLPHDDPECPLHRDDSQHARGPATA